VRIAAGQVLEDRGALVRRGDDPSVVGEQPGEPLRRDVLRQKPRPRIRLGRAQPFEDLVHPHPQRVRVELDVVGGLAD
jgi:hypothetical protein